MCMRFWPGWSCLKQIVADEPYGKIHAISFRRLSPPPGWSKATYSRGDLTGGALLDLHIHDTDFVQFLFGRPAAVFSNGITRGGNAIDHVVTQYQFRRGPVVSAEGTWLYNGNFNMAYTLICDRATLDFDLTRGADALRLAEAGKTPRSLKCPGTDGHTGELSYLLKAIQTGKRPTVVTARDALSAIQICEAEAKSVRTGRIVSV